MLAWKGINRVKPIHLKTDLDLENELRSYIQAHMKFDSPDLQTFSPKICEVTLTTYANYFTETKIIRMREAVDNKIDEITQWANNEFADLNKLGKDREINFIQAIKQTIENIRSFQKKLIEERNKLDKTRLQCKEISESEWKIVQIVENKSIIWGSTTTEITKFHFYTRMAAPPDSNQEAGFKTDL